jgi:CubicO group peptidase (beta-lactamase class C family)
MMAIESICWIFTVFGFGYQYLNRPGKTLRYLSEGAYPIYIIHMIIIFAGSYLIFPMDIPVFLKLILMIVITTTGCFGLYDLLIRRTQFLRPFFGLKVHNPSVPRVRVLNMRKTILIFIILALVISGCVLEAPGQYTYQPPEKIQDGLVTGTLEAVNLNERHLAEAVNEVRRGRFKEVHSILISRNDKLVFEEYFQGHQYQWDGPAHHGSWVTWDRTMLHQIASDTKSITSACIGIAVDKGYIKSVHQSIFDYLPEYQYLNTGGKEAITIEHLLTMTSGLAWDEWSIPLSSPANDIIGLWFNCEDQIACILERPLVDDPGTHFTYCGGNMILLGEILRNASGMKIDAFSREYLFGPLGIDSIDWFIRYPSGVIESAGGLKLTPRAMLKIGVTYLHRGIWEDQRILPEEWVAKSARPYQNNSGIRVPKEGSGRNGYGYSWWVHDFRHRGNRSRMFYAGGWGDQLIMVIPELNAVVVFTGGNYTSKRSAFRIFRRYILPAFG